jgi:DNA invertase Pin-like site-specific DNA recombinase
MQLLKHMGGEALGCAGPRPPCGETPERGAKGALWFCKLDLEIIRDTGTGLYIHTQAVDTTTPAGRAMFGMLGIFAEFEREMIHARVVAGIERVRGEIQRNGRFTSKAGKVRKRLGRPNADPKKVELARQALANGTGVLKTAKLAGLGTGTVQRLKRDMEAAA